jgi:ribosomal protein S18 acetylase RimI-like enzyme
MSPSSRDLVVEVEAAAYEAWPAAEESHVGGWIHRYGDGFSRRLNSVTVMPGADVGRVGSRAAGARDWLERRGVPAAIRVLTATPPQLDAELAALGYTREGVTVVMTGGLPLGGSGIRHSAHPDPEWLDAQQRWSPIPAATAPGWLRVLERIEAPATFATRRFADAARAVGIGVVRRNRLVILEVATDPGHRRRGHASALVTGLGDWAAGHKATGALLQVVAENDAAIGLYQGLGFVEAYRYWYRRPPPGAG